MSARWLEPLRDAWTELARHPARTRQFRTRRLSTDLSLDAYAAIRAVDDAPCLLIEAEVPAAALFEVGGMRLDAYLGDDGPLLVLMLEDPARAGLFATVCADAIAATEGVPGDESLARFLVRLDAWRRFLRERRVGLSQNEAVGLLGELLLLERLLRSDRGMLPMWTAPDDGLHDFTLHGHALEIKATLGPASTLRISSLDQLDPSGLRQLNLVHVRLVEMPNGRALGAIIAEIEQLLPAEPARRAFANALLQRGLMPDDTGARGAPVVTVRSFSAYSVDDAFPKLIRVTVPPAVQEAEYSLEIRALTGHSVDFEAVVEQFIGGVSA